MKKSIIFTLALAAAATVLSSCNRDEDMIFDTSAAERTDEARIALHDALCADGGKWVMEYFANDYMPGYSYVMTFSKDGSVRMASNNDQIGGDFRTEASLWDVITDDGIVLSFNSYNPIFHIFADPDATNGKGLEGDYEFIYLSTSEDGNTIHLKGKKHSMPIVMRRLSSKIVDADFCAAFAQQNSSMFNATIRRAILRHGATGEEFGFMDGATGVPLVYPLAGDSILQSEEGNIIITADGIRFMRPLRVSVAANPADSLSFSTFRLQPDGTLLCDDENDKTSTIMAPPVAEVFTTIYYGWRIDTESTTGSFRSVLADISSEASRLNGSLIGIDFMRWSSADACYVLNLVVRERKGATYQTRTIPYQFSLEVKGDNAVEAKYLGTTADGEKYLSTTIPSMQTFINMVNGIQLKVTSANGNLLAPSVMRISLPNGDYFDTKIS